MRESPMKNRPEALKVACLGALVFSLAASGCSDAKRIMPSDRSWLDGSVTLTPIREDGERAVKVRGRWPGASSDLWIRYELCLRQEGKPEVFLVGASQPLDRFARTGTHVIYSGAT